MTFNTGGMGSGKHQSLFRAGSEMEGTCRYCRTRELVSGIKPALIQMVLRPKQRLRRFFWMRPEWWIIILVLMAWAAIIPHAVSFGNKFSYSQNTSHTQTDIDSAHHAHSELMFDSQILNVQTHNDITFAGEFFNWCFMILAMMVPLMLESIRRIAFQSFRYRRHRSMLFSLIGYLLPWIALGLAAAWLRTFIQNSLVASLFFVMAAIWLLLALRKRFLMFCHKTMPIAPSGWKADRDCLRFGLIIGTSCVATCGFLMLGCAFTNHSLVAMVGSAALGIWERNSFRHPTNYIFAGTLLLAIWFLLPVYKYT